MRVSWHVCKEIYSFKPRIANFLCIHILRCFLLKIPFFCPIVLFMNYLTQISFKKVFDLKLIPQGLKARLWIENANIQYKYKASRLQSFCSCDSSLLLTYWAGQNFDTSDYCNFLKMLLSKNILKKHFCAWSLCRFLAIFILALTNILGCLVVARKVSLWYEYILFHKCLKYRSIWNTTIAQRWSVN